MEFSRQEYHVSNPSLNYTCKDPFPQSGHVLRYLDISLGVGGGKEQFSGAQDSPCRSSEPFSVVSELCRQSTEALPSSRQS